MMGALKKLTPTGIGNTVYNRSIAFGKKKGMSMTSNVSMATRNAERAIKNTKRTYIAGGVGLVGASTAMRPNSNQTRGGYRGPAPMMSAPPGSGRYA